MCKKSKDILIVVAHSDDETSFVKPKFFEDILGKTLIKNVESGDPVTWDCFGQD